MEEIGDGAGDELGEEGGVLMVVEFDVGFMRRRQRWLFCWGIDGCC